MVYGASDKFAVSIQKDLEESCMGKLHEKVINVKYRKYVFLLLCILAIECSAAACGKVSDTITGPAAGTEEAQKSQGQQELSVYEVVASYESELKEIPAYTGGAYVEVNDNIPFFTKANLPEESFEYYSELDELGRCSVACANIGQDIMPTEERGKIGQVKPSGWHTVKYDTVDGKYLYNRCHLIGYQLSAENANEKNLITGTRYLNVEGMLPFENRVADYVNETGNHVLYRVEPFFEGDNLLASGVLMEGWSVEDDGAGVCFNVFVFNVQPDIAIDYANGDSHFEEGVTVANEPAPAGTSYILNTNTHKFHDPACGSVKQISEANKREYSGSREEVIGMGYEPCQNCHP